MMSKPLEYKPLRLLASYTRSTHCAYLPTILVRVILARVAAKIVELAVVLPFPPTHCNHNVRFCHIKTPSTQQLLNVYGDKDNQILESNAGVVEISENILHLRRNFLCH
jgi:hypothetical protein